MPEKNKKKRPYSISFKGVTSLAKQSFKDECDVNNVIERFTRTGKLDHLNPRSPQYGEAPEMDAHTAACMAAEIASMAETEAQLPPADESPPEDVSDALPGLDDLEPDSAPAPTDDEKSADA